MNSNNTNIRSDLVQGISYAGRPMKLFRTDAVILFRLHIKDILYMKADGFHFSPVVYGLFSRFCRNVFSRRCQTKQGCVSSGVELFASLTAMGAADDGIPPSMVQSAQLQQALMA